jgi:hypothetical protein
MQKTRKSCPAGVHKLRLGIRSTLQMVCKRIGLKENQLAWLQRPHKSHKSRQKDSESAALPGLIQFWFISFGATKQNKTLLTCSSPLTGPVAHLSRFPSFTPQPWSRHCSITLILCGMNREQDFLVISWDVALGAKACQGVLQFMVCCVRVWCDWCSFVAHKEMNLSFSAASIYATSTWRGWT